MYIDVDFKFHLPEYSALTCKMKKKGNRNWTYLNQNIYILFCPTSILTENTLIEFSSRNNNGRLKGRNDIINLN